MSNIATYKYNSLEVHLCDKSVDDNFFDLVQYNIKDRLLFLSHNFNEEELSVQLKIAPECTIEYNEKDKEPLKNLQNYIFTNSPKCPVFIEGD